MSHQIKIDNDKDNKDTFYNPNLSEERLKVWSTENPEKYKSKNKIKLLFTTIFTLITFKKP